MKLLSQKIIISLFLMVAVITPYQAMAQNVGYDTRHPVYNDYLTDGGEKPVNLQRYRGNIVFLVFWATWCQRCIKQLKILDSLAQSAEEKTHHFLARQHRFSWFTAH